MTRGAPDCGFCVTCRHRRCLDRSLVWVEAGRAARSLQRPDPDRAVEARPA
jgi:hypothetical protein